MEVVFHDQRAHKRVPHLNDFFGFTMAALGEKVRRNPIIPVRI